ncbi:MAG: rpfC [Cyanobacteria bacterium RYN_339]|nr:rpfC [Cyanobacteria bacterium RYN_339]
MTFPPRLNALVRTMRTDRAQLLEMLERSPGLTLILRGPDHVLDAANQRFRAAIQGRDPRGLTFREAFPSLADGPHHARLDAVFGGGEPFEGRHEPWWVAQHPDGSHASFDYVYVPLRAAGGEVEGVGVMAVDASECLPARPPAPHERDLLAGAPVPAQPGLRQADDLFASLSYDLRTAAHVVLGYASVLGQDGGEVPTKLKGAARVLASLVNDVLDLEKLRSGVLALERRSLSFTELMDTAIADLAAAARAKGHRVVADLPASLPPLVADAPRLLRAMTHALDRTIEITPLGGEIHVQARVEGPHLVCEIAGGGLAFPDAQGLRMARALVEVQGGTLEVLPGASATCRLSFPLAG